MSSIDIYANNDTFISMHSSNKNFSQSSHLLVGENIQDFCTKDSDIALLQFDLSSIYKSTAIENAELYLYVNFESYYDYELLFPIEIYRILDSYNSSIVTWQTGPTIRSTGYVATIIGNNINCYIKIDISTLVEKWIQQIYPNNGIALVSKCSKKILSFKSSRSCNGPFLRLKSY